MKTRKTKIEEIITPHDPAGVPRLNSSRRIAAQLKKKNIQVSKRTVQRDLSSLDYSYAARPLCQGLTERQKVKRVQFALNYNMDTSRVIFTDEKIFDTNDGRRKMWVRRGQKAAPRQKVRWAPRCQVWGAVGVGWRYLVILQNDTSITSEMYIETLKEVDFPPNRIFQQDGATAHTARASKEYIESAMSELLKTWPPNSPDLSPIENVWSMVQGAVDEQTPSDKPSLIRCVRKAWSRLSQNVIDKTVLSFDSRLKECIRLKGEKVKKW